MRLLPLARNRSLKIYIAFNRYAAFSSCYHTFIFKKEIIITLTYRPVWGVPNRLEKLKGDLKEFYSIRINNQWRIIFKWINNDAYEIRIVDYH